jgi:hypothetical protein
MNSDAYGQALPGGEHGGDDPLGVARAAAVHVVVILGGAEPRRHGVDVRVENDAGRAAGTGQEVETRRRDVVALRGEAETGELALEELADGEFALGRRRDVNELSRQRDRVDHRVRDCIVQIRPA